MNHQKHLKAIQQLVQEMQLGGKEDEDLFWTRQLLGKPQLHQFLFSDSRVFDLIKGLPTAYVHLVALHEFRVAPLLRLAGASLIFPCTESDHDWLARFGLFRVRDQATGLDPSGIFG